MLFPVLSFLLFSCNGPAPKEGPRTAAQTFSFGTVISEKEKKYFKEAIAPMYQSLLVNKGFNGAIIAAKKGEIVFEDYHGYANFSMRTPITENTTFHLASISKTFTGMVILRLMEQGKLKLDDAVETYLPTFPYRNVTIKNLLTHRSGLPNYIHFMDGTTETEVIRTIKRHGKTRQVRRIIRRQGKGFEGLASNQDVLDWMVKHRPAIEAQPDRCFKYCNTNYVLLAMIAEKASGIPFPTYMHDSLFAPLGMNNSYVFTKADIPRYCPSYMGNRPQGIEMFDCVYGDKSVYSTPRDMLQWDKALYAGSFVSQPTLEMAFTGYSNEHRGEHNYGLGWRLLISPEETIVYHNGWWHGNNTVFTRLIKDTATLIVLGNRFNRNIYAARRLTSVFTGNIDTTKLIE